MCIRVCLFHFLFSVPTYQPSWRQNVTAQHVPRLPQTLMLSKNVSRVRKTTGAINMFNISFQIPLQPLVREHIRTRTGRCCRRCWRTSARRPPAARLPQIWLWSRIASQVCHCYLLLLFLIYVRSKVFCNMYIGLTNVNPVSKSMSTPPGLNFGMSVSQRVVREKTSSRGRKKPYLSIFCKKTQR